jgi:FkbM family methyltransferase
MISLMTARRLYRKSPVKLPGFSRIYHQVLKWRDKNRVVVKEINGIYYELHLAEFIDSEMYYFGFFEEHTTKALKTLVKPGMTVLDIGANVGIHTLLLAQLVQKSGRVIAFEPMPWARRRLHNNISLNRFDHVHVEPIALAERDGAQVTSFRTSWNKFGESSTEPEHVVPFERLDSYLRGENIDQVDFIKLDVDGFELKVIAGAMETLQTARPTICMELGNWTLAEQGGSLRELVDLLLGADYRFYNESELKPLVDYDAIVREFPDLRTWTINVITAHESVDLCGSSTRSNGPLVKAIH